MNVARGGLLDYEAVKAALESEHISGLGMDVQWQEPIEPDDYFAKHARCDPRHYVGSLLDDSDIMLSRVPSHLDVLK